VTTTRRQSTDQLSPFSRAPRLVPDGRRHHKNRSRALPHLLPPLSVYRLPVRPPARTELIEESANVILHLLPKLDLASVAMKYAQSGTPPSQITVQSVDADIRSKSPLHRQASLTFSTTRHGDRPRVIDHPSPHSSESVTSSTSSSSTRAITIPVLAFAHHRNLVGPTTSCRP